MWEMSLKTRLFVHLKPQIIKKIENPGTRVLKSKNLTRPKAKKPGYPGFQVPGFRTLIDTYNIVEIMC